MKIGLLLCDHADPDLAAQFGDYPDFFETMLGQVQSDVELIIFDVLTGQLPQNLDACDAYIVGGSRFGANDPLPWIKALEACIVQIVEANKKLIGSCFGHQIIAKALGGTVITSPEGWGIGVSVNQIIQSMPWMKPHQDQFNLHISHQDQVVTLPSNTQVLAQNSHCPYYMLQIGENVLTIQGHPEYEANFLQALMNKRQKIYDPSCYDEAIKSLRLNVDNELIAQWIFSFIKAS